MIVATEHWMLAGGGSGAIYIPRPSDKPLPDQSFFRGGVRFVAVTQPYWLNMNIPFSTPGVISENCTAFTDNQNFPLFVRCGYTNMEKTAFDTRVRIAVSNTDANWSTNALLIGAISGVSRPFYCYPHGYLLPAQATLRGDFINSPTDPQDGTSKLIFWCERPETQAYVPILEARDYWVDVALNLAGAATATGSARSSQIQHPVLIKGAVTNASPLTMIRIFDTQKNISWSSEKLPIGAFAGILDGQDDESYVEFPKPYLLDANASLLVEWTNGGGAEVTGRYINFIGERITRQPGKYEIPTPPQVQPVDTPVAIPAQVQPPRLPPVAIIPQPAIAPAIVPQAPVQAQPQGNGYYLAGAVVDRINGVVYETYRHISADQGSNIPDQHVTRPLQFGE